MAYDRAVRIEPLGDSAYIVRDLGDLLSYTLAQECERLNLPGVQEIVPAFDTLGVYVDRAVFDPEAFVSLVQGLTTVAEPQGKMHLVPVCYELGDDLKTAAQELGLSQADVVYLHADRVYRCYAVGFVPGFPYLGYLPEQLCGLARLASPRVRVPSGAVGIVGDQTGIYPGGSSGGWRLIGRTPLTIVDLQTGYFPIKPGDQVRFQPVTLDEFSAMQGARL